VDGDERDDVELPALDERSDAWLVGRARELLAIAQVSERGTRTRYTEEVDRLLAQARHRGEPRMVGQLLRAAAVIRVNDVEQADTAESAVDEFLAHSLRHGLLVLQADAHALRAKRLLLSGTEDVALTEAAVGLAMLDDKIPPDALFGPRVWDMLMASTLMDIGLVLMELGVYEVGDQVIDARREEESQGKRVLQELEEIGPASPDFEPLFAEFHKAVLRHAEYEEQQEFPELRTRSNAERHAMAVAITAAEATAMDRILPGVESALKNLFLRPVAAVADRIRDLVRKAMGRHHG